MSAEKLNVNGARLLHIFINYANLLVEMELVLLSFWCN